MKVRRVKFYNIYNILFFSLFSSLIGAVISNRCYFNSALCQRYSHIKKLGNLKNLLI